MMSFLAFLGVAALVIVTPGPDTAITIRNALIGGRRYGVFTALGISIGQAIWALCTAIGVVALLVACEPLFLAIKYAGAAYLIFLGLQSFRDMLRSHAPMGSAAPPRRQPLSAGRAFRQGLISDLGNPKMAVFFASLLPQFALPSGGSDGTGNFLALLALGLVFSLMTFCWLAFYSLTVARAGAVLRRPSIRRLIDGVTGAVLLALGLRVAVAER